MNSKHFVEHCFNTNPKRYGCDDGDLNIVNDGFAQHGYEPLTREQFALWASLVRTRNKYLAENPQLDFRSQNKPVPYVQRTIYDYFDDDTATQTKKLTRYFTADPSRLNQSPSRIKKSVRGVDNEHIIATKVMLPLFSSEPPLKKMRVRRQHETPYNGTLGAVSVDDLETKAHEGAAGE